MPIYDFSCPACGPFETAHPMSEVPRSGSCPRCGGAARRVFSTAGLSRAGNPAARAIDAAQLGGPGLIYVATRRETTVYAEELTERGWRAEAYHAGHNRAERDDVHARFLAGDLDVVVATTAFGMGSHKPNVRFVLHADIPESLDSYYQQIARAGRDGDPAVAVLHYRSEDLGLQRFFGGGASSEQDPRTVFREVRGYRAAESISPKKAVARAWRTPRSGAATATPARTPPRVGTVMGTQPDRLRCSSNRWGTRSCPWTSSRSRRTCSCGTSPTADEPVNLVPLPGRH